MLLQCFESAFKNSHLLVDFPLDSEFEDREIRFIILFGLKEALSSLPKEASPVQRVLRNARQRSTMRVLGQSGRTLPLDLPAHSLSLNQMDAQSLQA